MALSTEVYASVSFMVPEVISMGEELLRRYIAENKDLSLYNQYFEEILRQQQHVLSEREEELLALSSEVMHASSDIFTMFNNADIKFPFIKDEEGNEVELTKGRYIKFLESKDRRVREDAFHAIYSSYSAARNTLAASLGSNVKKNKFFATARKYSSSLQSSLDNDNVSTEVYDNLIDTVNKNLPLLHRYLRLRKKALKIDDLHMYDLYAPIVEEPPKVIKYEEALEMVKKGLVPLGDELSGIFVRCLQGRLD